TVLFRSKAGVVKSVDAFVSAQQKNPKGIAIQAGAYTLKKGMSAESAVTLMLSPLSKANFVIPEGKRNSWVYAEIDKRLELKPGTTKETAFKQAGSLGLPDWARNHADVKDPLEGFLFPASYPVAKGNKPEDVLRKMVGRANAEYLKLDLDAKSRQLGLKGPWELLTVASLVQAEGKTHDDFTKMAEVIYNRLQPDNKETFQLLQFDSSYNYLMGQSKIKITRKEVLTNPDPYNTYKHAGLTPGPIGNPGVEAVTAALNPTKDGWMYFVATDGMNKTEFAKTLAEHDRLVQKFNAGT
ncbi:membrane protein, partial [Streptomyces platensis subsp. clarensis]|nr:membrane protein [Streptomyces platensis subsp. clarensis]